MQYLKNIIIANAQTECVIQGIQALICVIRYNITTHISIIKCFILENNYCVRQTITRENCQLNRFQNNAVSKVTQNKMMLSCKNTKIYQLIKLRLGR